MKETILLLQIIFCFAASIAIILPKRKVHNYKAAIFAFFWSSSMLSAGIYSLLCWPEPSIIATTACAISAGLAIYSKGSVFKVIRLLKSIADRFHAA